MSEPPLHETTKIQLHQLERILRDQIEKHTIKLNATNSKFEIRNRAEKADTINLQILIVFCCGGVWNTLLTLYVYDRVSKKNGVVIEISTKDPSADLSPPNNVHDKKVHSKKVRFSDPIVQNQDTPLASNVEACVSNNVEVVGLDDDWVSVDTPLISSPIQQTTAQLMAELSVVNQTIILDTVKEFNDSNVSDHGKAKFELTKELSEKIIYKLSMSTIVKDKEISTLCYFHYYWPFSPSLTRSNSMPL